MPYDLAAATLYDFPFSSASYRVRIALSIKGIAPRKTTRVNLRTKEHLNGDLARMTGAALVPAMDFGDAAFGQSLALIDWLDDAYPEPRLVPRERDAALIVRGAALSIACDVHPLNTPRVLRWLADEGEVGDEARADWYRHWVRTGLATVEELLHRHGGGGAFCFGDKATLADVCLVPQVLNARRNDVPIDDFERVVAVDTHCTAQPAFQQAAPKPLDT